MIQAWLVVCSLALPSSPASDWPQWRGINRDGSASASALPGVWPAVLPAPAWQAKIGEGYSAPVVAQGSVYVMGRDEGSMETCLCFDAQSGKPLWRHAYHSDYVPPDPRAGNGPKSTPTVDGDRVYMLGLGGMFHCLDSSTGRVLWKHDFNRECWGVEKDTDGVDSWFPPCGCAASALVDGSQVIVPVGGKKVGALAAFDRTTGALIWHALPERSSYGSPIIANLAGIRQLIGFTGLRMASLDLAGHSVLWQLPFPAMFEQTITTPVIWKDLVIVSGEQRPTVALRITRSGAGVVSKEVWQNPDLKAYMTSPVIFGDYLVGGDSVGKRLVCVDLATGVTKWTSPRILGHISLMAAGDRILALSSRGELTMLKADASSCQELTKWKVGETGETWAYPALAGGRLYIKDKDHLLCYDLNTRS